MAVDYKNYGVSSSIGDDSDGLIIQGWFDEDLIQSAVTNPSGSMAATETGADTFAATGTTGGAITGALAATETGADTFASTGKVIVKGSLAATETGADTFASTGKVIVKGSLSATETGADTFAASGKVIVKGSLAATETGADTFASTGTVIVRGSLAATESPDTFAASGKVIVKGSLAASETGADAFAASGKVIVKGSLAASETGADAFAASGIVRNPGIVGTMAATETGADAFASTGTLNATFCISGAQAILLRKIWMLHGLGGQLAVGPTSRVAGDITQTVSQAGSTVTVGSTTGGGTFSGNLGTMIEELAALHGLTTDLVTSATSRTAGSISQTFTTAGSVTTVTRI